MRIRELTKNTSENIYDVAYKNGQVRYFSLKGSMKALNEDSMLVADYAGVGGLLIVADGMGGHPGGDEASEMILKVFRKQYHKSSSISCNQKFFQTLDLCNKSIINIAKDCGTTLCIGIVYEKSVQFICVGDSLALVLDAKGEAKYASFEESSVAMADELGVVVDEPFLLNYMGFERVTYQVSPHISFAKGDKLFLMTDGAHEFFEKGDEENIDLFVEKLIAQRVDHHTDDATCIYFTK